MAEMDKEPRKENEIWCAYCGPGWKAVWELAIDESKESVCDDHHFILRQIHIVSLERKIGEEKWNEVHDIKEQDLDGGSLEDLGDWKDLIHEDDL